MKTTKMHRTAWVLGLVALAACDEGSTGPLADALAPDEERELAVLEDETSFGVALEVMTVAGSTLR